MVEGEVELVRKKVWNKFPVLGDSCRKKSTFFTLPTGRPAGGLNF